MSMCFCLETTVIQQNAADVDGEHARVTRSLPPFLFLNFDKLQGHNHHSGTAW